METNKNYEYTPSHPVHPFEILEEELTARGISKKDFALQLGMHPSNFSRLLRSKCDLTVSIALRLEKTLGIPFAHWMKFQEAYSKDLALHCKKESNRKYEHEIEKPLSKGLIFTV